jgi:hypothetical protein
LVIGLVIGVLARGRSGPIHVVFDVSAIRYGAGVGD